MDEVLEGAAREVRLRWDHTKDWKGGVHMGVNINEQRHWKFREEKANAAFQLVRRPSMLPPREKERLIAPQILPIKLYGAELHSVPSKGAQGYAAEWSRTPAWRGSRVDNRTGAATITSGE